MRIIVNADDLGISTRVNAAIFALVDSMLELAAVRLLPGLS